MDTNANGDVGNMEDGREMGRLTGTQTSRHVIKK